MLRVAVMLMRRRRRTSWSGMVWYQGESQHTPKVHLPWCTSSTTSESSTSREPTGPLAQGSAKARQGGDTSSTASELEHEPGPCTAGAPQPEYAVFQRRGTEPVPDRAGGASGKRLI